jgi:hypothetical protein
VTNLGSLGEGLRGVPETEMVDAGGACRIEGDKTEGEAR